jgi:putative oxidoreductase
MSALLRIAEQSVGPTLLVGRLLLAWIFLHEGLGLAANLDAALAGIAKLGVSAPLAVASIALQLVAGAALALGLQTRLAALALALFCVATAILFHTNLASRNELLHFEKDLAIAGGMFVLAVCGAGAWSIDGLFARAAYRSGAPISPPCQA